MDITEEKLAELVNKAAETATAKALEEFKKSTPAKDEKDEKDKKDKNEILEKIEEDKKTKAEKTAEYEEIKAATAFNLSFDNFKKDNVKYLPEETDNIINTIDSQIFDNEIVKSKTLKVTIMDKFFEKQANVDILNGTQKNKIAKYKELTQDAKRNNANQYWEVLEIAIDRLKDKVQAEAAKKANQSSSNQGTDTKYDEKIFATAKNYFGGNAQK
jgi:hypothetical protein